MTEPWGFFGFLSVSKHTKAHKQVELAKPHLNTVLRTFGIKQTVLMNLTVTVYV